MADYEAIIEITAGGSTFKISGSEAFIEKMIETLPALFPAATSASVEEPPIIEHKDGEKAHESIDEFVARLSITNATPDVRKVSAFVYYLTEVVKHATCNTAQIEECFDVTGLKTPAGLRTVINNAGKANNGGYIRSVSRGNYAVTTNGKNLVKEMAKA